MSSSTVTDLLDDGDPDPAAIHGGDLVALGSALHARSRAIAAEVASEFPAHVRVDVAESAQLATEVVGRWVAKGERGVEQEWRVLVRSTEKAILVESDLVTAVHGYHRWRDLCNAAVVADAASLGIGDEVVTLAGRFVQLCCDEGLDRTVRTFDESWQALQERLRTNQSDASHQVLYDDLTGLPNRLLLIDRLQHAVDVGDRRQTTSILLFLDLDSFTAINDRFGHPAGDTMLVEVGERLLELVRSSDTVARVGGDEFAILVEDLDEAGQAARNLTERVHQSMCVPVIVNDLELHSSMSIGMTEVTSGVDPEILLSRADAAMHRARRGGRDRFAVYDMSAEAEYRSESRLADELRMALSRGELTLDYQPLFRLDSGTPVGLAAMEALLRWEHPEFGSVDPDVFVPLLEQSRQIVPVGRWVLEEAASQCVEWQRAFPDLTMSVNVSARQLHDPGFLDDVADALRRSGLDPAHLVLEVSEPAMAVDMVRIGAAMQAVRNLGVRMALDDFGTGHSSLLHLEGLTFDRLKVDRTFVSGLDAGGHLGTVIRTVVDLAHHLGITVVAEGVENAAELRAVGAIGCDEAQGDLLAEPTSAHLQTFDFVHLVASMS